MGTSKPTPDMAREAQREQDLEDIHDLVTRHGPKALLALISEACTLEASEIERVQPYSSIEHDHWMMEGYQRAAVLAQEASDQIEV